MNRNRFTLALAGVAILAGLGTWWMYQRQFGGPIAEARTRAAQLNVRVSELQTAIKKIAEPRAKLAGLADATLGIDAESVVHELRVALIQIGETAGIKEVVVDSRMGGETRSPAAKAFSESKKLRDAVDFGVVEGTIEGKASYREAAEVVALVESQAWPKRIRSVSLQQSGKDADAPLEFRMTLETLYLPGRAPRKSAATPQQLRPVAPERAELVQRIAAHNLFTRPQPAPRLAAAPMSAESPARLSAQWIVTGWAEGSAGWELWIRSTSDQQTRSVRAGERVQDSTFVGVRDGYAVLDAGGQRFAIALGEAVEARDRRIE